MTTFHVFLYPSQRWMADLFGPNVQVHIIGLIPQ
jgi:hypothetical protein